MLMTKPHQRVLSFFIALVLVLILIVSDKYAFFYGVLISVLNLSLAHVFLFRNQRRITKKQGESLGSVVHSMIVRTAVVGLMLVLGFAHLAIDPVLMLAGFVLGQLYYLLNQLVEIIRHGK